jgi:hypothetical protein
MKNQKARTQTAAMARALSNGLTAPKALGLLPEMIHTDCIAGTERPWYDRIIPAQTMATKSKTSKTEPRIGEAHLANRYRSGYSGGVGKKPKQGK